MWDTSALSSPLGHARISGWEQAASKLDLGPKYVCLPTLRSIDRPSTTSQRFEDCHLKRFVVKLSELWDVVRIGSNFLKMVYFHILCQSPVQTLLLQSLNFRGGLLSMMAHEKDRLLPRHCNNDSTHPQKILCYNTSSCLSGNVPYSTH